jgi:transcriptional regulator with XRE-family HTH domain
MHRTAVGAVERGEANVTIDNMERLAAAVGIELSELLAGRE